MNLLPRTFPIISDCETWWKEVPGRQQQNLLDNEVVSKRAKTFMTLMIYYYNVRKTKYKDIYPKRPNLTSLIDF